MRLVPWAVVNHVTAPNLFYFPSPLTVVSLSLVIILIVDLC